VSSSLSAERVRTRTWSGSDVSLQTVAAELSRLHTELTHEDTGDQEHPRPRNSVLNLVVAVSDGEREDSVEQVVKAVAAGHPLRAIVFHRSSEPGQGLDASITTQAHTLVRGASVQMEQVTLRVRGPAGEHPASLVEPLLVSDVPSYLWWTGSPPLGERGLHDALAACDALIVDSAHFSSMVESFLDLSALAERMGTRVGFVDLEWARQRPWRETVAQFFAPEARRRLLKGLRGVTVESVGPGQVSRVGGMLFAGWLMAALGWRLTRAMNTSEGGEDTLLDAGQGRMVELEFHSGAHAGLPNGALRLVRFHGEGRGKKFSGAIEIRPDRADHAHMRIDLEGAENLQQRLPMPQRDEAELLLHALSAVRQDPVYMRSLEAASRLLEALR
jgi:glucose-6-phosphate dehydrogenase assembly protein OpcA